MDKNENWFYLTICYSPKHQDFGLEQIEEENYRHTETGNLYYKTDSYDLGWGLEYAYILDREYIFSELINIILHGDNKSERQIFVAISFVMVGTKKQTNFRNELIKFCKEQFLTGEVSNIGYFKYFFINSVTKEWDKENYVKLLRKHKEWKKIEKRVKEKLLCII